MDAKIDSGKTRMSIQARSEGDGMEMVLNSESLVDKANYAFQSPQSLTLENHSSFFPLSMRGKHKEPKFIPYEPYKAAVSPILSKNTGIKSGESYVDASLVKPLVSKIIAESSKKPGNGEPYNNIVNGPSKVLAAGMNYEQTKELQNVTWLAEKLVLENHVKQLIKEKKDLEVQFNIQTKVNADLKKLLVASLGEDMQVKVQYMSEDKAKLGEHVLLCSQKLSQNSEQLDKLSVQCDMWKSKFEASSLLVDELVAWKVVLSRKFCESTNAIQCLLREYKEIYKHLEQAFWMLHYVQESFDPSAKQNSICSQSHWNLTRLAYAIQEISDEIQSRLLGKSVCVSSTGARKLTIIQDQTHGEQKADEVLTGIQNLPSLTKQEIRERRGTKMDSNACLYLPHTCSKTATVNCCKHCSGEIRFI